jgi:hypothetical protein
MVWLVILYQVSLNVSVDLLAPYMVSKWKHTHWSHHYIVKAKHPYRDPMGTRNCSPVVCYCGRHAEMVWYLVNRGATLLKRVVLTFELQPEVTRWTSFKWVVREWRCGTTTPKKLHIHLISGLILGNLPMSNLPNPGDKLHPTLPAVFIMKAITWGHYRSFVSFNCSQRTFPQIEVHALRAA